MNLHNAPSDPPTAALVASDRLGSYTTEPVRRARLFRNGANQAVRIPREFEMPGTDVLIRRDGSRLIIEQAAPPLIKGSPAAILAALEEIKKLGPYEGEFPDVDEGLLPLDDIVL